MVTFQQKDRRNTKFSLQGCGDCNHGEHEAGECASCNCGSSEIIRKHPMARDYYIYDECARPYGGGRRVYEAPKAS